MENLSIIRTEESDIVSINKLLKKRCPELIQYS